MQIHIEDLEDQVAELLEALKEVVAWAYVCTVGGEEGESMAKAKAAIAKAETLPSAKP